MIAHAFPEGVVSYAPLRCSGRSARRSTLLAFAATGLASLLDTLLSYSLATLSCRSLDRNKLRLRLLTP